MMSLVQQNIQDMLEEMDDAPELGISKDSIDAIGRAASCPLLSYIWFLLRREDGPMFRVLHFLWRRSCGREWHV